jgi:hypothetical protein
MKTKQEILDAVQTQLDETFEGVDLQDYIHATPGLTDEELEWACANLGAEVHLSILK